MLSQDESIYSTGIPQLQAYFRTLICDSSKQALHPNDFKDATEAERFYNLAIGFLWIFGSLLPNRSRLRQKSRRIPQHRLVDLDSLNDYAAAFALWEGCIPDPISEEAILEPFLGSSESQFRLHWPTITNRVMGRNCRLLFADAMGNNCRNRSFCITENGYMGLVPPGTQNNDQICIFAGCELPLVIRQIDDKDYFLVGSCYIYGLMHGEIMKSSHSGQCNLEILRLR